MKRTSKEVELVIIKLYQEGLSMAKIGKKYGLCAATILAILRRNNIEIRTKGGIYALNEQNIIEDYKSGKSSTEIAKMFNVNVHTITNILEKNGVERNNIYHNLDLIDDYWETIDSYDKAYFLGFMITDGNITGNNVCLQLSSKDKHIIETFKRVTKNSNKIHEDKRNLVSFYVKRKKWVNDLSKYGVIPNKTSKVYLPILNEEMMSHLLRGMIDGDGWISAKTGSLGFCGNERTVSQVRDYLVNKVKIIKQGKNLYMINWASKKDVKAIGEYLYKDKNDCYLTRKFNNFCEIIHANTEVSSEIA